MSAEEVDEYLRGVDEPKRGTLQALRQIMLEIVPEAQQGISYRIPAFRVRGQTIGGFAAFEHHLSYLPFSGSVLAQLAHDLKGYTMTKSSLHFAVDRPLPKSVVQKLVAVRLAELRKASQSRAASLERARETPPEKGACRASTHASLNMLFFDSRRCFLRPTTTTCTPPPYRQLAENPTSALQI
jgi:uncharacterized protein YdhG (YjbR/CyaY superfamily)